MLVVPAIHMSIIACFGIQYKRFIIRNIRDGRRMGIASPESGYLAAM